MKKERAQENLPEAGRKGETGHGESSVGSGRIVRKPWAYKARFGETRQCCGKWTLQHGIMAKIEGVDNQTQGTTKEVDVGDRLALPSQDDESEGRRQSHTD